jgi:uncharacterized protein YyaL (SSP411 family)
MSEHKFTNHLIHETSPYLQQHAHNPVDWFAWNEETLEKAKIEDKPILLSVGYSSCHWCHVMEHESFEDEETAKIMNENFVCIKVDKEERPDLDQIYINFVSLTTGSAGYPLNVFLTSNCVPFFGGTYFPPVERYRMPSWKRILTSVADAYRNDFDGINHSAFEILGELRRVGLAEYSSQEISFEQLDSAFNGIARSFDQTNGGFGGQPKFPPSMVLEFLLAYYQKTENPLALEIVEKTLNKMANGGIYDQIGGGFHRYTVDAIWLTPHFEKMLYDNAQLALVYLHAFQFTKNEFFKQIAVETLEYVKREMTHKKGGFFSAQDADSEGIEGKFFVWEKEEIEEILGEDAKAFCFHFDVSEHGNFEEKNILNVRQSVKETAKSLHISVEKLDEILSKSKQKLFEIREKRIKPFRDEKVLVAWNGLMLRAFAEASAILQSVDYLEVAKKNADFILQEMVDENDYLLRSWKDGKAKLLGYLEDYANFIDGLLALYQVCGEIRYLKEAKRLTDILITEFWDEENGGFFLSSTSHENLILRPKDFFDNAEPSGNSVAIEILLKLSKLCNDERYEKFAISVLRLSSSQIRRYPNAFGRALQGISFYLNPTKEIVIFGEGEMISEVYREFLPNKVVVLAENIEDAELIPLLQNRGKIDGKQTAYVCENFACQMPVTSVEQLKLQLS